MWTIICEKVFHRSLRLENIVNIYLRLSYRINKIIVKGKKNSKVLYKISKVKQI